VQGGWSPTRAAAPIEASEGIERKKRKGRKRNGNTEEEEGAKPPPMNFCFRHCTLLRSENESTEQSMSRKSSISLETADGHGICI
jgi:hypothetical protein